MTARRQGWPGSRAPRWCHTCLVAEIWDDRSVVAALHYDEASAAEDLAAWCDGEVVPPTIEGAAPTIWVPTYKGPKPASLGDWIVRRGEGEYYPMTANEFAMTHTPIDG